MPGKSECEPRTYPRYTEDGEEPPLYPMASEEPAPSNETVLLNDGFYSEGLLLVGELLKDYSFEDLCLGDLMVKG